MTNERTIAAAVVVYNTACADSPTCRALARLTDRHIRVLIYDNSTRDMGNAAYCRQQGWDYLGGTGNVGISKAYNACIERLLSGEATDLLCLFDDDTELDAAYFDALEQAVADGGRILVPLIYAGGALLSPCLLDEGHQVRRFADEREALAYRGAALSAINSCMAIALSVFADYRYDENIFLDGVDHAFLADMKKRGETITVFPYRCEHAFSGVERPSKEAAMTRFRIYARDYAYILRDQPAAYRRLVGKRALRLCWQYKTLAFLRVK